MLTSESSQTEKYLALAKKFLLRRDWLTRAGTVSTVHMSSCTVWWSFSIL